VEIIVTSSQGPQLHLGPADGLDGQMQLPRQPPFSAVIGIAPAALVTVDLGPDSDRAMRS